jgi:polar amino acid transport system substrate-binding protein
MKLRWIVLLLVFCCCGATQPCGAADKTVITYAGTNWPPYCWSDSSGTAIGLYPDLLRALFEQELQMKMQTVFVPWKRAQLMVETGEADILVTVPTAERRQYALISQQPLVDIYLHVFAAASHPRLAEISIITSAADILRLDLRPVTNIGNIWHQEEIDSHGINTVYVPSEENAFLVLAAGRADISIEPSIVGMHLIKKFDLGTTVTMTPARFGPLHMHLLVSKNSPFAMNMDRINTALQNLHSSGRIAAILARYQ